MTEQHPITPPPELIRQWIQEWINIHGPDKEGSDYVTTKAAQWGADQELEACVQRQALLYGNRTADELRAARRPKPPSLKEQALAELEILSDFASGLGCDGSAIRRALEQLDD